jgi:uncharacterized protein (TIGR02145 family)
MHVKKSQLLKTFAIILSSAIAIPVLAQDDIRTIHRMPEEDLKDRLDALKTILAGPNLDTNATKALDKLRKKAEEVASINFECNSVSINDMPNQRCKEFYLKELPKFEQEYSKVTGNYYLNKITLAKGMKDRRSQINACVNGMDAFLNPDFTPEKFTLLKLKKVNIDPVDETTIDANWTIEKAFDTSRIITFRKQVGIWTSICMEIVTNTNQKSNANNSEEADNYANWNPYFVSQINKYLSNSNYHFTNGQIWYKVGWMHSAYLNGSKLLEIPNLSADGPYLTLLSNGTNFNLVFWKGEETGTSRIKEGEITLITKNEIFRDRPKLGIFTDIRDGHEYKTVNIDNTIWMAENLNYNNSNSYCYENDTTNCSKYGRMYGFSGAKSACPNGWHLPDQKEWEELFTSAKSAIKKNELRSVDESSNNEIQRQKLRYQTAKSLLLGFELGGNDALGFDAIGAGMSNKHGDEGNFSFFGLNKITVFWSTTELQYGLHAGLMIDSNFSPPSFGETGNWEIASVRCVEN